MSDEKRTVANQLKNGIVKKSLWAYKGFKVSVVAVSVLTAGIIIGTPFIKDYTNKSIPTDTDISQSEDLDDREGLQTDPDAKAYEEPVKEKSESTGVSVPGWSSLDIPAETSEVTTVDFFNPETNAEKYSLTFELRIPDDSEQGYEVLYKSGLVEPGLHIQKINLSRGLKAGVYDATIHVQPYRMDESMTATNNADLKTQLIVS